MPLSPAKLSDRSVVIHMTGVQCTQPTQVFQSATAAAMIQGFIDRLRSRESTMMRLFEGLETTCEPGEISEAALVLTRTLGLLVDLAPDELRVKAPDITVLLSDPDALAALVEMLYDHWRAHERYLIFEGGADESRDRALEGHLSFIHSNDDLNRLVRDAYQRILYHLRGHWPRVYRQVPSGANMSLLIDKVSWPCPPGPYQMLKDIKMVRLALMVPPVVLYPFANRRVGKFEQVDSNPLERVIINPARWHCLPIRVGQMNMLVYFDRDFLAHAVCLLNLFEIGGHNEAREKPDGILVFGVPRGALKENPTVFFEDEENDLVLGVIARSDEVDYLGYFKKMLLTLHNVAAMRKGRLPVHGAMCRVDLKGGRTSNVVIVGDSGAGKSETLEAFRILADEYLRGMTIIFDDMGSLAFGDDGSIIAYGTEIGAFVRLDDLDTGYAFGRIDRSILVNPHRQNARVVIPITDYVDVVAGHTVDMLLYANNFEDVDDEHPIVDRSPSPEAALDVFRKGLRTAKGTSDESGLVGTYFGNPFGPEQLQERHEPIAARFFQAAFDAGIPVGQLRTRLGVEGMEREGPIEAAKGLFDLIRGSTER